MITHRHCAPFVGQHVIFRTAEGLHHGVLHTVTNDGILVRPIGGASTRLAAASETDTPAAVWADKPNTESLDVEEAWFPFFFFPFLALWWLTPWAWW